MAARAMLRRRLLASATTCWRTPIRPALANRSRALRAFGSEVAPEAPPKRELPPLPQRGKKPAYRPGAYAVPRPVTVPAHIPRPSYADHPHGRPSELKEEEYAEVKTEAQIQRMRRACGLAAEALQLACETAKEGVTTHEVDNAVAEFVMSRGAYPVGINYYNFPRGLCASPNEVALHGVPNMRPLEAGDIVNFDVTVFLDGGYGDCSKMVCIGEVDDDAKRLCDDSWQCMIGAMAEVGPGVKLSSLGAFCAEFGAERGYGVVAEYCGHFIGRELHMRPNVLHVHNTNDLVLKPGMTFTIEPILLEGGSAEISPPLDDGWTIISPRGAWSAQSEHTVLVTENGVEPLTVPL